MSNVALFKLRVNITMDCLEISISKLGNNVKSFSFSFKLKRFIAQFVERKQVSFDKKI